MKNELQMAAQAKVILEGIASGDYIVTHVYTDQTTPPADHVAWMIHVRTDHGHHVSCWMEGVIVHKVTDLVDTDGRRLLGDHNQINVQGMMTVGQQIALTDVVMTAFNQTIAS